MDVKVKYVSWTVLANKEVNIDPTRLEWPKNFGSVNHTPDELLLPGWKYLVFQLWLIRTFVEEGMRDGFTVNFPEYDDCVESISRWGADSMWTLPNLLRSVLGSLFDKQLPYLADYQKGGKASIITLHNHWPSAKDLIDDFAINRYRSPKKDIKALNDNEEGFNLLRLYRYDGARPVFDRLMMSEPMSILSCTKLAFKNEIDAILHQQMVILDEQETAT